MMIVVVMAIISISVSNVPSEAEEHDSWEE